MNRSGFPGPIELSNSERNMSYHFGFNCRRFIPNMGKCRQAIDDFKERKELLDHRWVSAREALVYLDVPAAELLERTDVNDIKPVKDGQVAVRIRVEGTWKWDDCPLADTGGQCAFYDEHDGPKITCAMETRQHAGRHPNLASEPSAETVRNVEEILIQHAKRKPDST